MGNLSRRSVLRSSLAVAAAGTLARPYLANAAAATAEVWWAQGFVPEEDAAIKKVVADYQKQKEEYTETALLNTYCYNNVTKKRSFYGIPYTTGALPNHIWRPLVEKAG